MPKITQFHEGKIFVKLIGGKWRASWTCPLTGRHIRRILPVTKYQDARDQAENISREVSAGRGFHGRQRGVAGHTVRDAIKEAVKHSDGNHHTRQDYLRRSNAFLSYLEDHCAGVKAWKDVTEQVLQNYIEHCRRQGLAHDSIRLRLYPLRMTAAHMSRTYPTLYRDTASHLRLRRTHPAKAEADEGRSILSPVQLRSLLAWLKEHEPMVHVWAVAQGLAGMRLYEVGYLTETDMDPSARTLEIRENLAHRPKTAYSHRTIPVCPVVATAVSQWIHELKVRSPHGFLFFPERGMDGRSGARSPEARVGAFTRTFICHAWGEALNRARLAGIDIPEGFTPRRLRSTFVTLMREAGADFATLQAYVGHRPATILSMHYDKVSLERLRAIADLAQQLAEGSGAFKKAIKNEGHLH